MIRRRALSRLLVIYGPDMLRDLRKKVDLMRAHGLDGQRYLVPPR